MGSWRSLTKNRCCSRTSNKPTLTGQLLQNRVSDNVGGVKYFLSTLRRAPRKESHFALVEGFAFAFAFPTVGSLVIVSGQDSVRPMHLFGHNRDHDYQFRLPS